MILPNMLPPTYSAMNSKLCIHRSSPGFDLVPISRFQIIRVASMSVSCGSLTCRASMCTPFNSGKSFSLPIMVERKGGEIEVKVSSEKSKFEKCVMKKEMMMEEKEACGDFEVESVPEVPVGGGVGSGGGGGENWFGDSNGDSGRGSGSMDEYYQKMIEAYPGDALILSNYARFLKEVKKDAVKAEEYCERAILAKPNDGNVLSLYGDLIWQTHRDEDRARTYFHQAVNSSPNDCYVLASYAKFL
ncbi:uncharacterized protein LOC120084935 isoform X2 [Benincasa hispida]|uniref:uncharacterized protein LOC120084935 isoform X2 n=1 Tax=Benincasa hispida TaxID=102211 RepID=UPI0019029AFD|nr:uncharacterized protein LOC120084935 isoform X2 [Benincasa hispida]